jgi:hypothetical protein
MSAPTQQKDIAYGIASEMSNLDILQSYLDTTLERKGGYAVFDFENPNKTIFVELKSRRIKHDAFDTAIIGFNKIAFANHFDDDAQFWFAFCYTDGVYVVKYNRAQFDNYEVRNDYVRGARSDTHNKPQKVVMIPIDALVKLEVVEVEEEVEEKQEEDEKQEEEVVVKLENLIVVPQ